ncbi:UPF0481 protein At3g47200-like [Euphorbia lathyris]|uniref:UPF0481 protein At3g47200-like n=1 Tax=Euphorbia lathyris TaxID=212925 RepID=UPI003313B931
MEETEFIVDLELLSSMQERTKKQPKLLTSSAAQRRCSIFRVPQNIKKLHPRSFIPEIVSIGPYYHGEQHLQMIQEHKWRFLGIILHRLKDFNIDLSNFFKEISIQEEEIRACYSENIDRYNTRELIQMMILDGCFIIELLCVVEKIINPNPNDPIFNLPWILTSLTRDLLRLENQIPFFVLQSLYKLSIPESMDVPPLQELILELCKYSVARSIDEIQLRRKYRNIEAEHILDFYRSTFIPLSEKQDTDASSKYRDPFELIQPVEKLREAGIKVEERKGSESFLDIKFREDGVLEIPRLVTDDMMSSFILNCIALEQSYKHRTKHFTSYVVFMGCLINTVVDAGCLRDEKIIENFFGTDEQVVKFFNEAGRDVTFDIEETYLSEVFKDVDNYYRNVWHVRWAEFKYNYFGSPWIFLSAFVAFFLLLLTILQSFFSVYSYFSPPN